MRHSARLLAQRLDLAFVSLRRWLMLALDTVLRLEKGETLRQRTGIAIREALEEAGVEFLPAGGVRVKLPAE